MIKTNSAVFYQVNTPFQIQKLDLEKPRSGEVLVKMKAAGICHSDWHLVTGDTKHPLPVVPGHEGSGVVAEVGDGVNRVKPGDHVILNWAPSCGTCFFCLHHQPSLCTTYVEPIWAGTMMDGSTRFFHDGAPIYHFSSLACFSEYTVVSQECCVRVPPELPHQVGALIGCAVTTGIGSVLNTAKVKPGSKVAVFGAGGVGLSVVMGARLAGAGQIIAVDRVAGKEDLALQSGATHFVIADEATTDAIHALTGGVGVDYAFEAVGIPQVQEACFEAIRPGGTAVFVGIAPMGSQLTLPAAEITRHEKTVRGSYYGSAHTGRDFRLYADLYLTGKLQLDRLVSKTYPLEAINEAYDDMLHGEVARGVIDFSGA